MQSVISVGYFVTLLLGYFSQLGFVANDSIRDQTIPGSSN